MELRFADPKLDRLANDEDFTASLSEALVNSYRRRIDYLRAARDERALRVMKSYHFEKLEGKRSHQHSIKLNDQFRLILEFEGEASSKVVVIVSIEDYHH